MTILLIIALICGGSRSPLYAQDKAGKAVSTAGATSGATTPSKPQTTEDEEKAEEKKEEKEKPDVWVTRTNALGDLIKKLLDINWALVALIALAALWKQLVDLFMALTEAMKTRAVNLEVSTVKIQVSERVLDISEDRPVRFSTSPFDLDEIPKVDQLSSVLDADERPSQLTFPVSDYVGGRWVATKPALKTALEQAWTNLTANFAQPATFQQVRNDLLAYARACERSRFFEAHLFGGVIETHDFVREGLLALDPQDPQANADEYVLLHVAGVGCAQGNNWKLAKQFLDKIATRKNGLHYLPAGDTWIACAYLRYLQESLEKDVAGNVDSYLLDLLSRADELLTQGQQFILAMDDQVNRAIMARTGTNAGYYKREIRKVVGTIAGIVADYAETQELQTHYFDIAEAALVAANMTIDDDPSSSLDRNNLADLYRQRKAYAKAHEQINLALAESALSPDPTFYNTQAWIYWKERAPSSGLRALQKYGEAEARAATDPQDVEEYMRNQIFAAKLAVAVKPRLASARFARAADILEEARRFSDAHWPNHDNSEAASILAEIDELLGFTYLAIPGSEDPAVTAFDRLLDRKKAAAPTVEKWRRQLGHATALTRRARTRRRNYMKGEASEDRDRATRILTDSATALEPFGLDGKAPESRRVRHLRIHLDTASALHALARETLFAGVAKSASTLAEQEGTILEDIQNVLRDDSSLKESLRRDGSPILEQIQASNAHWRFVSGRILLQLDPSFTDAEVLKQAEKHFTEARGVSGELECQIDLSLGEMFLKAAQLGKGDSAVLGRRAISSFEFAVTRDAPKLHDEAVRVLAEVYSIEQSLKKKPAGKAAAASS